MAKKATIGIPEFGRISIRELPKQVREAVETLQKDGGKVLSRMRREAATLVTTDPRQSLDALLGRTTKLRKDLRKRADRALQQVESNGQKLFKRIEKRAGAGVDPVLRRLQIPSRKELDALKKRVHGLEQRIADLSPRRSA